MILHIEQLQPLQELCLDIDSQHCDFPPGIGKFVVPIHLDAHVQKMEEEVAIEGRISTQIEMICSRCLKSYTMSIDDTFEVIYGLQADDQRKGEEVELDDTELNVSYYQDESISVPELLREQLLLLLPMKPLCRDDCAGLCPSCGKDLNEEPCSCARKTVDPRLAVLEQLLHSDTTGSS